MGEEARGEWRGARCEKSFFPIHLIDEVAKHGLGNLEIGDDAVLHRAYGGNVAGCTTQHFFCLGADGTDLSSRRVDGHHAGLT